MSHSLLSSVLSPYQMTTKFLEREFDPGFIFGIDGNKERIYTESESKNLRKSCKSTHQHSTKYPPPLSRLCLCNCTRSASLVPTSSYIRVLQQAECRYAPIFPAHSASCFLSISNVLLVLCLLLLFSFCCDTAPLKIAV